MSSLTLRSINRALVDLKPELDYFSSPARLEELARVRIDWGSNTVTAAPDSFSELLLGQGYAKLVDGTIVLTPSGLSLAGKLFVNLELIGGADQLIDGRYRVVQLIASGKNSATFKVVHSTLDRVFVLKAIRPGAASELIPALGHLGSLDSCKPLVRPIGHFEHPYTSVNDDHLTLHCLLFPFIDAPTLRHYLSEAPPLSPYFVLAFIEQVAGALAVLQDAGAYHGDLHEGNILVSAESRGSLDFYIIDISFGISTPSDHFDEVSDFAHFQRHLWHALRLLQRRLPRMSLRKHLGARIHTLVTYILGSATLRFADILYELRSGTLFEEYCIERSKFIREHFSAPRSLKLLRYEEFSEPTTALELFEPFPELFSALQGFGNTLLYGQRGSGKSTYLAALATLPGSDVRIVDPRVIFGIYFACRQGEFRQFSADVVTITSARIRFLKHILVLKVIRRTVGALAAVGRDGAVTKSKDLNALYEFLERFFPSQRLGAYDTDLISPLENLQITLMRTEVSQSDEFFSSSFQAKEQRILGEADLRDFFLTLRQIFPNLRDSRFYLLFDDAGRPNVSSEVQQCINDLVRSVNPVYCVKISSERHAFSFSGTDGGSIEEFHDMTVYDIATYLYLGSGANPRRNAVEEYFRKILERRLKHNQYSSSDIRDFLGEKGLEVDELVRRLAAGRRNAYYAGWEIIWQLSDRTARNLLELVNAIFDASEVTASSPPHPIPLRVQDGAVVEVSERKLRALSYVPGRIEVLGTVQPLGRRLYEVAAVFGAVARAYLKSNRGKRIDERIAIERNDTTPLDENAARILNSLVRYGVLDDSHLSFARDDKLKKPLYVLNRIFCPAFKISFRRDQHIRLSVNRFELFLLEPLRFSKEGTQFLSRNRGDLPEELMLFEDNGK